MPSYLIGLDPAGPLFFPSAHGKSLARGDGHFVDVIHTNIGILGGKWAIGDADFIGMNIHILCINHLSDKKNSLTVT